MTDQANTGTPQKSGFGKVGSSVFVAWLAGYFTNQLSLHGVDFTTAGVPSEVVKSSIEAVIVGVSVWLTPQNFVDEIVCFIVFCKTSWKKIRGAAEQ